jgi:hypothetical protein
VWRCALQPFGAPPDLELVFTFLPRSTRTDYQLSIREECTRALLLTQHIANKKVPLNTEVLAHRSSPWRRKHTSRRRESSRGHTLSLTAPTSCFPDGNGTAGVALATIFTTTRHTDIEHDEGQQCRHHTALYSVSVSLLLSTERRASKQDVVGIKSASLLTLPLFLFVGPFRLCRNRFRPIE